jgi:hypothetical protein
MDMIKTTASSVYLDDQGLLHVVSNGGASSASTVKETFAAARTVIDRPVPTLFDARLWPVAGSDFWVTFIDELPSVVSAGAILIAADDAAALGGFPRAVNRLMVPFEVFTQEEDAIAFLVRFARQMGGAEEE